MPLCGAHYRTNQTQPYRPTWARGSLVLLFPERSLHRIFPLCNQEPRPLPSTHAFVALLLCSTMYRTALNIRDATLDTLDRHSTLDARKTECLPLPFPTKRTDAFNLDEPLFSSPLLAPPLRPANPASPPTPQYSVTHRLHLVVQSARDNLIT